MPAKSDSKSRNDFQRSDVNHKVGLVSRFSKRYWRLVLISFVSMIFVLGIYGVVKYGPGIKWWGVKMSTEPSSIQYRRDALGNVMVSWETSKLSIGMVIWGNSAEYLSSPVMSANDTEPQKSHMAVISAGPMSTVYFKIFSEGKLYGLGEKPFRAEMVTGELALPPS